jgi:hypothetical protein
VRHAVRMIWRGVATPVEVHATERFGPYQVPVLVRVVRYVEQRWLYSRTRPTYSREGGLLRDRHQCACCGPVTARTMDHVLPRSRGGATSTSERSGSGQGGLSGLPARRGVPVRGAAAPRVGCVGRRAARRGPADDRAPRHRAPLGPRHGAQRLTPRTYAGRRAPTGHPQRRPHPPMTPAVHETGRPPGTTRG